MTAASAEARPRQAAALHPGWTTNETGFAWAGEVGGGNTVWSSQFYVHCTDASRLYCFGTDTTDLPVTASAKGRVAFISSHGYHVQGSIIALDDDCTLDAQDAGLSGSYRAFLSTTNAIAASRFDAGGPTWVRTDGVAIVAQASDLIFADPSFLAPLDVDQKGVAYGNSYVMTGGIAPDAGSAQTCDDWTNGTATATFALGVMSTSQNENIFTSGVQLTPCTAAFPVYCLQQ